MYICQHTNDFKQITVEFTFIQTILTKYIGCISANCRNGNLPLYDILSLGGKGVLMFRKDC